MALPTAKDEFEQRVEFEEVAPIEAVAARNDVLTTSAVRPIKSVLTAEKLISSDNDWKYLVKPVHDEVKEVRDKLAADTDLSSDIEKCRKQGREGFDRYDETRNRVYMFINTKISGSGNMDYSKLGKDRSVFMEMILNEIIGLGPLEPLWSDDYINEIMIDGPDFVRIEKEGRKIVVPNCRFYNSDHLLDVCQQIVAPLNRQIDVSHPIVDARLNDLSRVNIVHPVIASGGPIVAIRRHRKDPWTLAKYIDKGSIDPEMARDLSHWVAGGCSSIIIGGTSSGKTSVLNSVAGQIQEGTRLVVIEDNRELDLPIHAIYEESRNAGASGQGEITLDFLVRNALRQAPDRIVVGEARDGNAMLALLDAMSTGHNGSISTIHANGAVEGVSRLVTKIQMDQPAMSEEAVLKVIADAVDLFVTIARFPEDGSRRMTGIWEVPAELENDHGRWVLRPIPLWLYVVDSVDRTPGHRKVNGHYEKQNDLSEAVRTKYRIEEDTKPSLEDVYNRSNGIWE